MHRWYREENRAARPPPDVIREAKGVLLEWIILLLGVALLGCWCNFMGWGDD